MSECTAGLELCSVEKVVAPETHIYPTSLQLANGSFNTLLGTTRSGKTTLIRLLAGIDKPTDGRILWQGKDISRIPVQSRQLSIVYQQFINYPHFTVYENIASPLRVRKMAEAQIGQRVRHIAELLKLTDFLQRLPSQLSGGQQQRCAIARALVKQASLVLLDEPLANLDFKLREELREELPKLLAGDSIFVYATTEPVEALLFGGKVITMHEGRVTQYAGSHQAYRQPNSLLSAQILSDPPINHIEISKFAGQIQLAGKAIGCDAINERLPEGQYILALRPYSISLEADKDHTTALVGLVDIAEISGSDSIVHFTLENGTSWIAQSQRIYNASPGDKITFYADLKQALYFHPDGTAVVKTRL